MKYLFFCLVLNITLGFIDIWAQSNQELNPSGNSKFKLHAYISDYAVFQRNEPIPIIGAGKPSEEVGINWNDVTYKTSTDKVGKLYYELPEQLAGGPHRLEIATSDTTLIFSEILVGDVWMASGQSNMEWPVEKVNMGTYEIDQADYPNIRLFTVPKVMEFFPTDDFSESASWKVAKGKAIADFSAVAYFFAKNIYEETGIPLGIIDASWGGTEIETWMSPESLKNFSVMEYELNKLASFSTPLQQLESEAKELFSEWKEKEYKKGIGMEERWYESQKDLSAWRSIQVPGYWEDQIPEYADFDGEMWYRRSFDLPKGFFGHDIRLWLSQIDDHNMCWINGHYIGETYFSKTWTNYLIPKDILKEKDNEIVLRVYDVEGKGGLTGLDTYFDFYPEGDNRVRGRLNGTWLVRAGSRFENKYDIPISSSKFHPNHLPSLLYHGMVHPFKSFYLKGVLWYQGESNKVNAYLYRELFPAMINDWRKLWQYPELPFYFVQIANYGPINSEPEESASAELRESQYLTRSVSNAGMVVTIDIGDANDIHPLNKKDVGERLARHALKNDYAQKSVITDGPIYRAHKKRGNKLIVSFANAEGLHTRDNESPKAFELAEANGNFVNANAKIKKNKIILWHPALKNPLEIRYAWSESPIVNLYNREGLPAYPFRTDRRKGLTEGQLMNYK